VLGGQWDELAADGGVGLRHVGGSWLAWGAGGYRAPTSMGVRSTNGRGSLTTPASAVAAAVRGDARNVRAPFPWRPSKLRLLVDTMYWPGAPWSPFMAMHMEQPASRHSAPAARNTSARPSCSACAFTCWLPGTTITRTPSATCRPRQIAAASPK